jgi:two-component system LytT family response regulator
MNESVKRAMSSLDSGTHITRLLGVSLNALEAKLDPAVFFRASRQHIVNLRSIESVESTSDDTYIIHLKNKIEVPVSRRQSRQLRESLGL